jgi:hypothetical protein
MALQYGANILASDMRKILEQNDRQQSGVRSWRQLFGNASLGFQAQSDALRTDYADAIAQAYKANLARQNAILGSGLSTGSTQQMLNANRYDLHDTYQKYIQGYTSDLTSAAENYGKEINTIDAALTERAQNFSKLYNSAYDYLSSELSNATMYRDLIDKPIYDEDEVFQGYEQEELRYLTQQGLEWLKDDEGNLLSWNEISNQILNPDGTLNKKGVEFFDQMFNAAPQGYLTDEGNNVKSFDEWMTEQSAEKNGKYEGLRDWMIGQDLFNYNLAGTNLGTANIIAGRESTDTKAGRYEYIDVNDTKKFTNTINALDNNARKIVEKLNSLEQTLFDPSSNLTDDQQSSAAREIKSLKEDAQKAWSTYQSNVINQKSKILSDLKFTLGSDLYNEFMTSESSFENLYQSLLNDMKSYEFYDAEIVKSINKWYNDFIKRVQSFVKSHAYTGKTSGY